MNIEVKFHFFRIRVQSEAGKAEERNPRRVIQEPVFFEPKPEGL